MSRVCSLLILLLAFSFPVLADEFSFATEDESGTTSASSETTDSGDSSSSDDSAKKSDETGIDTSNFPQWSKDLRRTEIITLGSAPFVTIWSTIGYSLYTYGKLQNPFSANSSLTEDDQKRIMMITGVACLGVGLTDLIITLIKRHRAEKKRQAQLAAQRVLITPASQAPNSDGFDKNPKQNPEYLHGEIQSAIF